MAAFRVTAELHGVFNQAVAAADCDKTAWLLVALRIKLNQPDSNSQMRMLELVERMEVAAAALAGGKQGITPTLYNEGKRTARTVLTGMCYSVGSVMRQGSSSLIRLTGQSAMTSRTWRR